MNTLSKILQALPIKHEEITYSGYTWQVYKFDNGKFFAFGKNAGTGSTGTLTKYPTTTNVGVALGLGGAWSINLPSIGQTSIDYADIRTIANAGLAFFNPIYTLSLTSISSTYVRFGSNASASDLTVEVFVTGTWESNS